MTLGGNSRHRRRTDTKNECSNDVVEKFGNLNVTLLFLATSLSERLMSEDSSTNRFLRRLG